MTASEVSLERAVGLTMGEAGSKVLAGPSGLVPATLLAPDAPGCANRTLQGPTSQAGVTVPSRCPWGWGPGQGESRTNCPLIVCLSVRGLELGLALGCGVCSPAWASPAEPLQLGRHEGSGNQPPNMTPTSVATYLTLHQVPTVQCLLRSLLGEEVIG